MVTERNSNYVAVLSLSPSTGTISRTGVDFATAARGCLSSFCGLDSRRYSFLFPVDGARNGLSWYDAVLIPGDEPC